MTARGTAAWVESERTLAEAEAEAEAKADSPTHTRRRKELLYHVTNWAEQAKRYSEIRETLRQQIQRGKYIAEKVQSSAQSGKNAKGGGGIGKKMTMMRRRGGMRRGRRRGRGGAGGGGAGEFFREVGMGLYEDEVLEKREAVLVSEEYQFYVSLLWNHLKKASIIVGPTKRRRKKATEREARSGKATSVAGKKEGLQRDVYAVLLRRIKEMIGRSGSSRQRMKNEHENFEIFLDGMSDWEHVMAVERLIRIEAEEKGSGFGGLAQAVRWVLFKDDTDLRGAEPSVECTSFALDFPTERQEEDLISFESFYAALCVIVDAWTLTSDVKEYVGFIRALHKRLYEKCLLIRERLHLLPRSTPLFQKLHRLDILRQGVVWDPAVAYVPPEQLCSLPSPEQIRKKRKKKKKQPKKTKKKKLVYRKRRIPSSRRRRRRRLKRPLSVKPRKKRKRLPRRKRRSVAVLRRRFRRKNFIRIRPATSRPVVPVAIQDFGRNADSDDEDGSAAGEEFVNFDPSQVRQQPEHGFSSRVLEGRKRLPTDLAIQGLRVLGKSAEERERMLKEARRARDRRRRRRQLAAKYGRFCRPASSRVSVVRWFRPNEMFQDDENDPAGSRSSVSAPRSRMSMALRRRTIADAERMRRTREKKRPVSSLMPSWPRRRSLNIDLDSLSSTSSSGGFSSENDEQGDFEAFSLSGCALQAQREREILLRKMNEEASKIFLSPQVSDCIDDEKNADV